MSTHDHLVHWIGEPDTATFDWRAGTSSSFVLIDIFLIKEYLDIINIFYNKNKNKNLNDVDKKSMLNNKIKKIIIINLS